VHAVNRDGPGIRPGLFRLRNGAEQLHQAEQVHCVPVVRDLSLDVEDVRYVERHLLAGGRYGHELASMYAVKRLAGGHFAPFGDLQVDGGLEVPEGRVQRGEEPNSRTPGALLQ